MQVAIALFKKILDHFRTLYRLNFKFMTYGNVFFCMNLLQTSLQFNNVSYILIKFLQKHKLF